MFDSQKLFNILINNKFKDQHKASHYIKKYCNFIKLRINRQIDYQATKNNTEKHHIVPKKWGGTDDDSNLIVLTVAEHIVAHHLLARTTNHQMIYAFNQIINRSVSQFNYNVSLKLVAEARQQYLLQVCKPVINLTTGDVYNSATEASKILGFASSTICGACQKHYKINDCYWTYIENIKDTSEQSRQQLIDQYQQTYKNHRKEISNSRKKPVVELDTGKIYDSAIAAANYYNTRREIITLAARKHGMAQGHRWAYVANFPEYTTEDFKRLHEFLSENTRQKRRQSTLIRSRSVINLTTKQIFYSICEASRQYNVQSRAIQNAIETQSKCRHCFWDYYSDDLDVDKRLQEVTTIAEERSKRTKARDKFGRNLINLDTGEVVANRQTLSRRYEISADRINYAVINHKLILGQYAWQYIDLLPSTEHDALQQLRKQYV